MLAPEGEGEMKTTHRAVLQSLADQGDADAAAELDEQPPLPAATAYLWTYFQDLHVGRPSYGMGPCRLPRSEIRAWEEGEGIRLSPWEVRTLVSVDAAWVEAMNEQSAASVPSKA
jgi:hypothetical protein